MRPESKQQSAPGKINAGSYCQRNKWIDCRPCQNYWKRGLGYEQSFQSAILSRLLYARIESAHGYTEVVEESESYYREVEIICSSGKFSIEFRALDETR